MKVGNREFSGKGAREQAGEALNSVIMSWRGAKPMTVRAQYKGFDILSRAGVYKDSDPEIFIRGKETYQANLNPSNPAGTLQSIDAVLRSLDRRAEEEQQEIEQREKKLADFKTQLDRPFEHEVRLNELMVKQAQLNAALDLDKSDTQVVADTGDIALRTDSMERMNVAHSTSAAAM